MKKVECMTQVDESNGIQRTMPNFSIVTICFEFTLVVIAQVFNSWTSHKGEKNENEEIF